MDAVTALPNITASNTIAGLAASGASSSVLRPDPSPALTALNTTPSSQVSFSQFALGVLAQQASDPTLNIDTAVATTLSSLLSTGATGSGPLYTATGQLQQFAGALLLTQTEPAALTPDTAEVQGLQLPTTSTPQTEAQRLQDIADTARQEFIVNQLTELETQAVDAQTSETRTTDAANASATESGASANTAANNALTSAAALATANLLAASIAAATAESDEVDAAAADVAATTPATPAVVTPAPVPVTTSAADFLPTTGDVLDVYQQAALASGLTAFGKELNSFIPSAVEAEFPPPVRAVPVVRAVVPRSEEPEEAFRSAA